MSQLTYFISFKHRGLRVEAGNGTGGCIWNGKETVVTIVSTYDEKYLATLPEILEDAGNALHALGITLSYILGENPEDGIREINLSKPFGAPLPEGGKIGGGKVVCEVFPPGTAVHANTVVAPKDLMTTQIGNGTSIIFSQAS